MVSFAEYPILWMKNGDKVYQCSIYQILTKCPSPQTETGTPVTWKKTEIKSEAQTLCVPVLWKSAFFLNAGKGQNNCRK